MFITACCPDITIITVKEQKGTHSCVQREVEAWVAVDGQGATWWEMVAEWLLLRVQSRDGGRRLPDAPSRIFRLSDLESEVGSMGRERSLRLKTGNLVEICKQHSLTPSFPICSGE